MSLILAAVAIVVSLITVAYQVRNNRKQARVNHHAALVASAFFDLYEGWALNRRAQIEPVNHDLLRTSAAQFYASAFRLSALIDGQPLEDLRKFMSANLGGSTQGDESLEALWALHCTVTQCLGYRAAWSKDDMRTMFWARGRNVPNVLLGSIEPASISSLLAQVPVSDPLPASAPVPDSVPAQNAIG